MKSNYILLIVVSLAMLAIVVVRTNFKLIAEAFTDADDIAKANKVADDLSNGILGERAQGCPTAAVRGPDGRISVVPSGQTFYTLSDYITYLNGLYSNGSKCIPPQVTDDREPIFGLIGGQGVGAGSPDSYNLEGTTRDVLNTAADGEETSARTPINKLDDYEYTRVFQTEDQARNTISKESKNQLMEKHNLDWANLPFNSEERAEKEDEFIAGRMDNYWKDPKSGAFFNTVNGKNVMPPDSEAEYMREQKILASYRPTDISDHVVDSETQEVAKMVMKVYENDPNWDPIITKTDEGKYEVTELIPKTRKERFEDAKTIGMATTMGFGDQDRDSLVRQDPKASIQITDNMRNDPFFDKGGVKDNDNQRVWNYNDFRKWTPDLERMFAPTAETKAWY
jgi:hypothetical protein